MAESRFHVRPATKDDLDVLARMRPPRALHADRIAQGLVEDVQLLVAEFDGSVVGLGNIVFRRPASWNDPMGQQNLPAAFDLWVHPDHRGRGAGTAILAHLEMIARRRGCSRLYIGVDPKENPRAHRLYLRLGYRPLDNEPRRVTWEFTDSGGNVHRGDEFDIQLAKDL